MLFCHLNKYLRTKYNLFIGTAKLKAGNLTEIYFFSL